MDANVAVVDECEILSQQAVVSPIGTDLVDVTAYVQFPARALPVQVEVIASLDLLGTAALRAAIIQEAKKKIA